MKRIDYVVKILRDIDFCYIFYPFVTKDKPKNKIRILNIRLSLKIFKRREMYEENWWECFKEKKDIQ